MARDAALGRAVAGLADDPDVKVRYQVALSLGEWSDPEAGRVLGKIASRDGADRWIRAAVLSSSSRHAEAVLEQVVASAGPEGPLPSLIEPLVATVTASPAPGAIARALASIGRGQAAGQGSWRLVALASLLDASQDESLADDPAVRPLIASARSVVADQKAPTADRASAMRLLGRARRMLDADRKALAERLDPSEPSEVQLSAIAALARLGDRASSDAILARWPQLGPLARAKALDALLAREAGTEALLEALEASRVPPAQVDASHRGRLLGHSSQALRERAGRAFGSLTIGPRRAVLDAYATAKTREGDTARGRAVFERTCATCHRVGEIGHEVGPDLAALTDTSPDALLTAILDPNREVDARYATYSAALKDGRVLTGLIVAETATAVTLKRQDGQADSILRADIDELSTSGRSLMPEGLENDLKPGDVADVMAFLARGATRPKVQEGNQPRTVAQRDDGAIRLEAAAAEIYGPTLTYEMQFGNLGYWHGADDRAAWTFRVDRPGTFTVSLEWACDNGSAGNAYILRVGDQAIRRTVGGTGTWSDYQTLFVRELTLPEGVHRLEMRPAGPVRNALADVRSILLTPRGSKLRKASASAPAPAESVETLARKVLDPSLPDSEREAIIRRHPEMSAELMTALVKGLGVDSKEEYRRIPWIWRVAIAAGRRNDEAEVRRLLALSLPEDGAPLDDWRAVALGGGLINGISLAGTWPAARLEAIVAADPALEGRWRWSLELASKMADAEAVPTGTRYDALRMIGMEPWDRRGEQLVRYLAKGVHPELQQGAISALGDVPSPDVPKALVSGLGHYTPANRKLAIQALVRDDARREALLDAVAAGQLTKADLGEEIERMLVDPSRNRSSERAKKVLSR